MQAGRDLDAQIAIALGYTVKWSRANGREPFIPELGYKPVPRYSSRMSDAWKVVDHLWRRHGMYTTIRRGSAVTVQVRPTRAGDQLIEVFDKKAPIAICLAAISIFHVQ